MKLSVGESIQNPIIFYEGVVGKYGIRTLNVNENISSFLNYTFGSNNGDYTLWNITSNYSPLMSKERFHIVRLRDKDNDEHTLFFTVKQGTPPISMNTVESPKKKVDPPKNIAAEVSDIPIINIVHAEESAETAKSLIVDESVKNEAILCDTQIQKSVDVKINKVKNQKLKSQKKSKTKKQKNNEQ